MCAVCECTCVCESMGMNRLGMHVCACVCMTRVWMSGVWMCTGVLGGGNGRREDYGLRACSFVT